MRFEIRRLHESFGITTLYVTHRSGRGDGHLGSGRGTAEDLFRRPRRRFVAEFIGRTNLVDAVAEDADTARRGSLRLRLASEGLARSTALVVSIRPHEIRVVGPEHGAPVGANVLAGAGGRRIGNRVEY